MMSFLSTFFYPTSSGSNVTKATAMSSVTSPTPAKSLSATDESSTVQDVSVASVPFDYVSSNPNPNTSSSIQSSTLDKSSKVITVTTIKPPTLTALASIPKTCVTFGANTVDLMPSERHERRDWLQGFNLIVENISMQRLAPSNPMPGR